MAISLFQVNAYPNGIDITERRIYVYGTVTLAAATAMPLVINWATLGDGNFGGSWPAPSIGPLQLAAGPQVAWFQSTSSTSNETYSYQGGKLMQATNGTFVSTAVADTLSFVAEFIKGKF